MNILIFQVRPVSLCFGKAFQKPSGVMTNSRIHPDQMDGTVSYSKSVQNVVFEVALEVKEDDGKVNDEAIKLIMIEYLLRACL